MNQLRISVGQLSKIVYGSIRKLYEQRNNDIGRAGNLAAIVLDNFDLKPGKVCIIYDTGAALEFAEELSSEEFISYGEAGSIAAEKVVKGIIAVTPFSKNDNRCWGAWQVKLSAGRGLGGVLYPIAYALSPNGLLMSDRTDVSGDADRNWSKRFINSKDMTKRSVDTGKPDGLPDLAKLLFDYSNVPEEKKRTPNFPLDDCKLRQDGSAESPLNWAYNGGGDWGAAEWGKGFLEQLKREHESFSRSLKRNKNLKPKSVEKMWVVIKDEETKWIFFNNQNPQFND